MTPDIAAIAGLIREIAGEHILPRFERLEGGDIRRKASGELVTIADLEAESALAPRLEALLPGSLVVGEEATAHDPAVLGRLAGQERIWLIDPVDGTANFAAGLPLFAVMVALVWNGETVAGWIHDPVKEVMATAEAGAGAWSDGRRLAVGRGPGYGNFLLERRLAGRSPLVTEPFGFRCAGQEYLALAAGRARAALYQRLMPWDHAAGVLLHREAGGWSGLLDGTPYSARRHEGGLLLAPDEAAWHGLRAALNPQGSS